MAAPKSSTHSPWTARPTRNALGGGPVVNHAREMSYDIIDTTGRVVAVVWAEEGVPVDLIAAAPEMLAALSAVAAEGVSDTERSLRARRARALLARLG